MDREEHAVPVLLWLEEALFDHSALPLVAAVGVAAPVLLGEGEEPMLAVVAGVPDAARLRVSARDADPAGGLLLGVREPEAHADAEKGAEALLSPVTAAVAVRSAVCVRAKLEDRVIVEVLVTEGRAAPTNSKIRSAAAPCCVWRKCCWGAAGAAGVMQRVRNCRRKSRSAVIAPTRRGRKPSKGVAPYSTPAARGGPRLHALPVRAAGCCGMATHYL